MDYSITVERIGDAVLVGGQGADGPARALASAVRAIPDVDVAVVDPSAIEAIMGLDPRLVIDLQAISDRTLCVVAPGFGSVQVDGIALADLLAELLGVEVVAPGGEPTVLADGTLFLRGPDEEWVSFHAYEEPLPLGRRFPVPVWDGAAPAGRDDVAEIPAGLWLRSGKAQRDDDPLWRTGPDQERFFVVVGAPGEESPRPDVVAGLLRELPPETRQAAVVAWYGSPAVPGAVAAELNDPVRAAHGVPGERGLEFVDQDGRHCWRPFAQESVFRPAGPPTLERVQGPPGLTGVEPHSFRLTDGWRVDVVPRGLVVRPESTRGLPGWSGATGPTADVVVASGADGVPAAVVAALDTMLNALPSDAEECLRLLPADAAAAQALAGSAFADTVAHQGAEGVVPAPPVKPSPPAPDVPAAALTGDVVVTPDGRVIPARPIIARARAAPAPRPGPDQRPINPSRRNDDGSPAVVPTVVAPAISWPAPAVAGLPPAGPATAQGFAPPRPAPARSAPRDPATAAETASAAVAAPPAAAEVTAALAVQTTAPPVVPEPPAEPDPTGGLLPTRLATEPQVQPPPPSELSRAAPTERLMPSQQNQIAQRPPVAAARPAAVAQPAAQVTRPAAAQPETPPVAPKPVQPEPARAAVQVEIPANVRSTAEQRNGMRKKLGTRYDTASRAVSRLLSERPGLQFGAKDDAALRTELAVVRVFAEDPDAAYDRDFGVCLADGLRRLPTARAVVVRSIPADLSVRPEMIVQLPAPVLASPASLAPQAAGAEALIWTMSGRRLDGLLDDVATKTASDEARRAGIVLTGHTRLRVLAVESDPVQRLLLAEDGVASEAALTRLRAAATARPGVAGDAGTVAPWFRAMADV